MERHAGDIVYEARIDDSEFNKNASSVEGKAQSTGQKVDQGFTSKIRDMRPQFRKMATVGAASFGAVSLGIGKAIQEAGQAEKISANFENTFGESSDTINSFIQDFGDEFAFVESELQRGATNIGFQLNAMGNIGQEEGEKITESLMTASGGLSDFFGEQMNVQEASQALAKGLSGNRQQLADMGFNVLEEDMKDAAEAAGMNYDAMSDQQEALLFTDMIMDQTKGSVKGLETSMDTFTGQQRRAKKETKEAAQALGDTFIPMAKDLLKQITPLITAFTNWIKENPELARVIGIAALALTGLLTVVGLLGLAIPMLATGFGALLSPVGLVIAAVAAVVAGLIWLETKTGLVSAAVKRMGEFFVAAKDFVVDALGTIQQWFADVWSDINEKVDQVQGWFKELKKSAKEVFNAIVGWIEENEDAIINWSIVIGTVLLPKIMQISGRFAMVAASAIKNAALTSAAWVKSAATTSLRWTTRTLPGIIAGFAKMALRASINAAKITGSFLLSSAQTGLAWGKTFAMYLASVATMVVKTAIAAAKMVISWMLALGPIGLIAAAVIGLTALIIANWDKVTAFLSTVWDWLKKTSLDTWEWIKGVFGGVADFFSGVWNGMVNATSNAIDSVMSFFRNLPGNIMDTLSGAGKWLVDIGKDMINGLIDGAGDIMGDMGSFLIDKLPGWIVEPFKKALGIDSPSKVFMEIGQDTMEGLKVGVEDTSSAATSAINTTSEAMVEPAEDISTDRRGGSPTNIEINLDGVMTRSRNDEREVGKWLASVINEELRAMGTRQIGDGNIDGFRRRT